MTLTMSAIRAAAASTPLAQDIDVDGQIPNDPRMVLLILLVCVAVLVGGILYIFWGARRDERRKHARKGLTKGPNEQDAGN